MSYLDIALKVVDDFKTVTHSPQESIQEEMNKIAGNAVTNIINIGRWKSSNETMRLENEAERIQSRVMNNKANLIDFKEAVKKWKFAGIKGA